MYGGHIVNDFDRLLANTYLDFYMKEELLDEMPLYPYLDITPANADSVFKAPSTSSSYDRVLEHIDESLKSETPVAFGLHPNAEIGFRTQQSEGLLRVILELSASSGDGAGGEACRAGAEIQGIRGGGRRRAGEGGGACRGGAPALSGIICGGSRPCATGCAEPSRGVVIVPIISGLGVRRSTDRERRHQQDWGCVDAEKSEEGQGRHRGS
jgi:hypothetical protein